MVPLSPSRNLLLAGMLIVVFCACRDRSVPDVSHIRADLTLLRFEKEFFSLDTIQLSQALQKLEARYPQFFQDFTDNILGLPLRADSLPEAKAAAIKQFLRDYRPVYDSSAVLFTNWEGTLEEIRQGMKRIKYYFPNYPLPHTLITFIGPMDALFEASLGSYGDVLTRDGLATGLQLHMGAGFSLYQSELGQSLYPNYISRRFTPATISVNAIKNIIDDLYPAPLRGRPLIDEMVEKGKQLYVLGQVMPFTDDTLKLGYTSGQLKGCYDHEGSIWNFLVVNNLLLSNDPAVIKAYMNDGPKTPELGDGSPGFIGLFVGWQIVKAYAEKYPPSSLLSLLSTEPRKIYESSKYRPQ